MALLAAVLAVSGAVIAVAPAGAAPTQWPAPQQVQLPTPTFDDAASSVTLPAADGVAWTINDEAYEPGTHTFDAGDRGLDVTVVATSGDESQTTTHVLPHVIQLAPPNFDDANQRIWARTAVGADSFLVTEANPEGIQLDAGWNDAKAYAGQTVTLEVRPRSNRHLVLEPNTFTHTFPAVIPAPTFDDATSSVTLPAVDGVTWTINGQAYEAGTHTFDAGDRGLDVTIVATAGERSQTWTHVLPHLITAEAPTFQNNPMRIWGRSATGAQYFVVSDANPEGVVLQPGWNDAAAYNGQTVTVEVRPRSDRHLVLEPNSWTHTFPNRPSYDISTGDEFNGEGLSTEWSVVATDEPYKGKAYFLEENLTVRDGNLEIRIRRHCLTRPDDMPSDANSTEGVCPAGTTTTYSSGRMVGPYTMETPGKISVRARMDDQHRGLTLAAWAHSQGQFCGGPYRTSEVAELDVLEVWGTQDSTASSHITCDNGRNNSYHVNTKQGLEGKWIEWSMEFDGHSLYYYLQVEGQQRVRLDGSKGPAVNGASLGITQERFLAAMHDNNFRFIAGVHLPVNTSWAPHVPDDQPFPETIDLIDYIRWEPLNLDGCKPTGAIGQEHAANPQLGNHVSCAMAVDGVPGAQVQYFENGRIYWSQATGAHAVVGRILDKYLASGGPAALGLPVDGELTGLRDGGASQRFQKVTMFWSLKTGAHWARGDILAKYAQNGWETGAFGYPITDEICGIRGGGCFQRFQHSQTHVYWTAGTGAHFVRGRIFDKYSEKKWENGDFGYPITDEICGIRGGGCFQRFQYENTHVYWTAATDAHYIRGRIFDRYTALGWENSDIGYPTTDEICGIRGGGCFQRFQRENGHIYWTGSTGAWEVRGLIYGHYASLGWENDRLGYPTGPEQCRTLTGGTRECTQRYQRGTITWNSRTGTRS
ncbi:hypothetical protein [Parenemella sanctibonifatiensis]|uniref:GH16 domain-containing protein n=1 Tax=Parenemella sanctibonifatiensis TaxID=2016505 RepID=A0A255EHB7_9ACTN|nr:hypothetical protein [Parenemella sanctibonifatiensis]OYN87503.1 hypothetical protein CGZ92_07250 [Parenemella sanctibonifatiensis]